MDLVLTNWALDSYLELLKKHVFSKEEFLDVIYQDVLLLKDYPSNEKFNQSKFWGIATLHNRSISDAYKMKWHNFGVGRVQLRLCIVILKKEIFVCNGYVKDDKTDLREMAKLKIKVDKIKENKFDRLGVL